MSIRERRSEEACGIYSTCSTWSPLSPPRASSGGRHAAPRPRRPGLEGEKRSSEPRSPSRPDLPALHTQTPSRNLSLRAPCPVTPALSAGRPSHASNSYTRRPSNPDRPPGSAQPAQPAGAAAKPRAWKLLQPQQPPQKPPPQPLPPRQLRQLSHPPPTVPSVGPAPPHSPLRRAPLATSAVMVISDWPALTSFPS